MENNENRNNPQSQNKRLLPILIASLILLIAGASLLYNRWGDSYDNNHLIIQGSTNQTTQANSSADHTESKENSAPEVSPTEASTSNADHETHPSENPAAPTEPQRIIAPDFTVYDADGNPIHLSDFIGKPIILNFWASWCGPCKSEMPDFDQAFSQYGENIHFVMVNCTDGYRETIDTAQSFIKGQGYHFPVYFDTASEAAYTYGASSIPMTFFIDAEGCLVAYWPGALDGELLQVGIDLIWQP